MSTKSHHRITHMRKPPVATDLPGVGVMAKLESEESPPVCRRWEARADGSFVGDYCDGDPQWKTTVFTIEVPRHTRVAV